MVQVGVIFTHFYYQTISPPFSFSPKLYPLEPCFHSSFCKSTLFVHLLHLFIYYILTMCITLYNCYFSLYSSTQPDSLTHFFFARRTLLNPQNHYDYCIYYPITHMIYSKYTQMHEYNSQFHIDLCISNKIESILSIMIILSIHFIILTLKNNSIYQV